MGVFYGHAISIDENVNIVDSHTAAGGSLKFFHFNDVARGYPVFFAPGLHDSVDIHAQKF